MTKANPAEDAVAVAENILLSSLAETTRQEAAHMRRIARMIGYPSAKNLSLAMTDRIGRSKNAQKSSRMWRGLLDQFGTVHGFSVLDHFLLELGKHWSHLFPKLVTGAVRHRLVAESREVILPTEDAPLTRHLAAEASAGTDVNLNQLGEAVLGEKEAIKRLAAAIHLLDRKDVDYVSVKISAIYSQINLLAWDESLETIKSRIRNLYRTAKAGGKFVNLDMEAWEDLELTVSAFQEVLSEPEFVDFSAGIALQAYLPDSIEIQKQLTRWAQQRYARGGAPIKIRLVKGANLAMEKVVAELHGWNPAPFSTKLESDACFKQMLEYGCRPENAEAVHLGVGSHNLFDVALALVLRERNGVAEYVELEMIQGMAPAQARAVQKKAGGLLLYSPIVTREEYSSALAYLIRRLDENTAEGNFLAHLFSLSPGSDQWNDQRDRFLTAWNLRNEISSVSRRASLPPVPNSGFYNEPDTDWTRSDHRERFAKTVVSNSTPPVGGVEEIEAALEKSVEAGKEWGNTDMEKRAEILRASGVQIAGTRFESIFIMQRAGKKSAEEADVEVSEAIDFTRYYAYTAPFTTNVSASPLGTVVVTPPWNFPFAIPCGGIAAALMAGNAVILKPAPEAVEIGWWLVQQFWKAGVPDDVLQFVACADGNVGRRLIEDPRTSAVVLTGAFDTARRFQSWRPGLKLFAETSGKNALVISALADRELAAADLIKSAFGHSGQKCSAASLGILEAEVYEDQGFLDRLRDAASSLKVSAATEPGAKITPLVQAPGEDLLRALTTLDEGEEWLLKPEVCPGDPCLWSPGIKLGVQPGSWFHRTECFGPVLGLIKAANLTDAVEWQNAVDYGLTAGIHSLDETEVSMWKERVQAGNLYINRGTTGAVVQRQPFGGWKRSSIGPGFKAGGPDYVNLFRILRDERGFSLPEIRASYQEAWDQYFSKTHDPSALRCESNELRYRPMKGVWVILPEGDTESESRAKLAAEICGVPLFVSVDTGKDLVDKIPEIAEQVSMIRTVGAPPADEFLRAVYPFDINWTDAPFVADGRLELARWMREQSVSETRHRYGNIISPQIPR
ncbi:MAG: bifunctional proline dehydrogenase/L-glutamate gamma-semialdehyde dehydrogenase [Verrucomicrobiales bacterium]|nr:bifunctional proline dehydrogenase/L-glutamate gamma-semialdehyde dehydrogenase [Verrucomicrobiales bacterium]